MIQTANILDLQPADLIGREFTLDDLPTDKGRIEIWEEFKPGKTYVVGADFALGMEGRDYDAAVVMVKGDGKPRQVAELHGHWGETFDRLLYAVLTYYGQAFFLGERQVGLPVMRRLWTDYEYRYLYFERDESKATRPYMDKLGHPRVYDDFTLRNLRRDLITGSYEIRSRTLWDQMRNLQFYAKGEEPGKSDRQRDEALRVRLPGGGSPDLCFVAGTLIETISGARPIETIVEGDFVLTRVGYRRVVWAGMTNARATVMRLTTSDGRSLVGTENHPVFVDGKGFVPLMTLTYADTLWPCPERPSFLTESSSAETPARASDTFASTSRRIARTLGRAWRRCTARFGKPRMDRSPRDATSTTSTKTSSTTLWTIWNACLQKSTGHATPMNTKRRPSSDRITRSGWTGYANTTPLPRVLATMLGWPRPTQSTCIQSSTNTNARGAEISIEASAKTRPGSARPSAPPQLAEHPALTTRREPAQSAERDTSAAASQSREPAPCRVVSVQPEGGEHPVFNLEVEDQHEYFANGLLVHNCMALAYAWLACREVVHYEKPKPKWERGTLGDLLGHETLEPRIDEGRGATWRIR
jgi:hypothetical protein